MDIGKILSVEITDEMQKSYLDYAMSVIVARALPDAKDGMKPVHRRILFAMHELGLTHFAKYRKSATVVGEVLGKYHPHGDIPVYDALVRLAQNFAMRYPLVDGQGNFGSVDGDSPAAMRYTEARLSSISAEMLLDIEKETVDFADNFDGTRKEPLALPAKLPNLLLMGSDGIAVGMATKIPPHNLVEVIDAVIHLIDHNEATLDELMQYIQGPDFPTGGIIYDWEEIINAYATGRGRIVTRAKAEIVEQDGGKYAIAITEIPYQVNKALLVAKIAELVRDKKINGISDLRDESDRHGMHVVIELKRDARPNSVLNNLYKHTQMQSTFNMNMVALVEGTPRLLNLKMALQEYIKHRVHVVTRRSQFELKEARARAHILEGLKIALDHLDEVIDTIKKSKDADTARTNLMTRFGLTEIQATAILDMQLRRLAALERQKIEDEYRLMQETIAYLENLLAHPEKILSVIKNELIKLKEKFGDPRRTKVYKKKLGEFSEEDLIPNEPTIVTVTVTGYVKRQAFSAFRLQRRGGVGVKGMTTKDEDEISHLLTCHTHDNILFFSDTGKVYQEKVYEIPEGSRTSKGKAVINLIDIEPTTSITSILTVNGASQDSKYVVMATRKGVIKKTAIKQFENIRRNGLIAINLDKGDKLTHVELSSGEDQVLLATWDGKAIKFNEEDVRSTGRDTRGVRGILMKGTDELVGMAIIKKELQKKDGSVLVVMQKGIGKRTRVPLFPIQKRGGQGVKIASVASRTGKVITCRLIPPATKALVLTSAGGQIVKLPMSQVPQLGRVTQGVILMKFNIKDDAVAAATFVEEDEENGKKEKGSGSEKPKTQPKKEKPAQKTKTKSPVKKPAPKKKSAPKKKAVAQKIKTKKPATKAKKTPTPKKKAPAKKKQPVQKKKPTKKASPKKSARKK